MILAPVRIRRRHDGLTELVFPFRESLVERLKATVPADCRQFDPVQRTWLISSAWAGTVTAILHREFGSRVQVVERRGA